MLVCVNIFSGIISVNYYHFITDRSGRFKRLILTWALLILQPFRHFTYVTTHSPTLLSLYLRHSSFSNPSVASRTSQFILQTFFRFSYVTGSSRRPTSPGEPRSFSNLSFTSPTSQLILQPFRRFTDVTAHSSTLPLLHVRHSSFSKPSLASPTSQALQLRHLASRSHSPTFASLHLRHISFSNPSVALPTSQFILQPFLRFSYVTDSSLTSPGEPRSFSKFSVPSPTSYLILEPFRRFTYVTVHSPTLLSLLLRQRHFTDVTRRAAHDPSLVSTLSKIHSVSSITTHLFQILFNIILLSASRPP